MSGGIAFSLTMAYLGTLAFVGWLLWMRWRGPPDVRAQIQAAKEAADRANNRIQAGLEREKELRESLADTRSIVDNLAMKSGLTPKR